MRRTAEEWLTTYRARIGEEVVAAEPRPDDTTTTTPTEGQATFETLTDLLVEVIREVAPPA